MLVLSLASCGSNSTSTSIENTTTVDSAPNDGDGDNANANLPNGSSYNSDTNTMIISSDVESPEDSMTIEPFDGETGEELINWLKAVLESKGWKNVLANNSAFDTYYATSMIGIKEAVGYSNVESIRIVVNLGETGDPLITYTDIHDKETKLNSYNEIPTPQTPEEDRTFIDLSPEK